MVGKALADLGGKSIVGIDIMPEVKVAAEREYPGVYENYYVEDLSKLLPNHDEYKNDETCSFVYRVI